MSSIEVHSSGCSVCADQKHWLCQQRLAELHQVIISGLHLNCTVISVHHTILLTTIFTLKNILDSSTLINCVAENQCTLHLTIGGMIQHLKQSLLLVLKHRVTIPLLTWLATAVYDELCYVGSDTVQPGTRDRHNVWELCLDLLHHLWRQSGCGEDELSSLRAATTDDLQWECLIHE